METYEELVNKNFKEKSPALIYNRTKDHAKTLVLKLIKEASKEIKLYTSGKDFEFYDDEEIKSTLGDKNISIKIILDDGENIEDYSRIFKNADIFSIRDDADNFFIFLPTVDDEDYKKVNHFLVSDAKSFRIEKTHKPVRNDTDVFAVASAYNTEISGVLSDAFDKIHNAYCS